MELTTKMFLDTKWHSLVTYFFIFLLGYICNSIGAHFIISIIICVLITKAPQMQFEKKSEKTYEDIILDNEILNKIKNNCNEINNLMGKTEELRQNISAKLMNVKDINNMELQLKSIYDDLIMANKFSKGFNHYLTKIYNITKTLKIYTRQISKKEMLNDNKLNNLMNNLNVNKKDIKSGDKKHGNLIRIESELNWTNKEIESEKNEMKEELKEKLKTLNDCKSNIANAVMANMDFDESDDDENDDNEDVSNKEAQAMLHQMEALKQTP